MELSFSQELMERAFAARERSRGRMRASSREILAMDDEALRSAFRESPMKRAKPLEPQAQRGRGARSIGNQEDRDR
jgi:hypothetical protein